MENKRDKKDDLFDNFISIPFPIHVIYPHFTMNEYFIVSKEHSNPNDNGHPLL